QPSVTLCPYTTLFRSCAGAITNFPAPATPERPWKRGSTDEFSTLGQQDRPDRPGHGDDHHRQQPGEREHHRLQERPCGLRGPVRSEEHTSELQSRENL